MGGGFATTWIVPSQDLVILRWNRAARRNSAGTTPTMPNLLLADLLKKPR